MWASLRALWCASAVISKASTKSIKLRSVALYVQAKVRFAVQFQCLNQTIVIKGDVVGYDQLIGYVVFYFIPDFQEGRVVFGSVRTYAVNHHVPV